MKHTKLRYWVSNSILLLTLSACGGGGGSSSTETSAPPTPPANTAPSANAGADQTVNEQTQVTLSGSGTDTDGSITSYKWAQTSGTSVSLSDANSANAGFMAPDVSADETLTFELTVTDNDGATAKDSISVVINNVTQSSTGQAALGALSGATIKVARFTSPSTVIETVTAQQSLSDTNIAGQFALTLNGVADNEWLIVSASGGQDIDANGDGTADSQLVSNQGTIHALAQASDWKRGGNISMLTEIAYQQAKNAKESELESVLQFASVGLLADDLNADNKINYVDLITFNPYQPAHVSSSSVAYSRLSNELFSLVHTNASEQALGSAITNIFDNSLDAIAPVELVAFSAEVNLPTNAKSLTESDVSVSSFVGDGDTVINSQGASLLTAENAQGNTLMLSYAIPQQAQASASAKSYNTAERLYLAKAESMMDVNKVEVSPKSTALALVMLKMAVSGTEVSTELAAKVLAHNRFSELESLVQDAFVNDPYFLDSLAHYGTIVDLMSAVATDVFSQYLEQITTQPQQTNQANSAFSLYQIAQTPEVVDDFWWGSPWDKHEPWTWFGESSSWNVTKPPFPATAHERSHVYATANPTMLNYVLEMFDDKGAPVKGADNDDWYLIARNSTMIQRVRNSHAAQTIHSIDGVFKNKPAHIEYNKYWLDGENTRLPVITSRVLNILHLTSGVVSLITTDPFKDYLKKVIQFGGLGRVMESCGTAMVSTVDFTSDSVASWLTDNGLSMLETSITACGLPIVEYYGGNAAKSAVKKTAAKAMAKAITRFTPTGWLAVVISATNELAPFGTSLFTADSTIGYDLTWDASGKLINAVRNDKRPNKPLPPKPFIDLIKVDGLTVTLDASDSIFDTSANPAYEWGLGDGNTESGKTISHTYTSAGTKDIRLTVYDGLGNSNTTYKEIELVKGSSPAIISMSCTNDNGSVDVSVSLIDKDDNNQVTVDWYLSASDVKSTPITSGFTDENGKATAELMYNFTAQQYHPAVKATDSNGNQTIESCSTRQKQRVNVPTSNLIAHYPFNGNANDVSGNGYHGIANGDASFENGVLNLDGNGDFVVTNNISDPWNTWSFSFWLKPDGIKNTNNDYAIIERERLGGYQDVDFSLKAGSGELSLENDNGINMRTKESIEDGIWTHVLATYDGSVKSIYFNGQQVQSITDDNASISVDEALNIGRHVNPSFPNYFKGLIDEVRIYNRSLSSAEVNALYQKDRQAEVNSNGNFKVSSSKVSYKGNYEGICQSEFGNSWQVADWQDIVDYYNAGNLLPELVEQSGLHERNHAWINRNGEKSYSSGRDYLISFHNGNKPSGYLAHDDIANHYFSLGSWNSSYYVMCKNSKSGQGESSDFDGNWQLTGVADSPSSECGNTLTVSATVTNGKLFASRDLGNTSGSITGNIENNGNFSGSFTENGVGVIGSIEGQFGQNQGSGTYRWSNPSCSGTWSATRTTSQTPTVKLNDTGITTKYAEGDDSEYGRDALAMAGQLVKVGGGNAGFDFTKLDANGNVLPESAIEWSCVRDNHTGLTWEVKTNDGGLRDKDNAYQWYNPDDATNGGHKGYANIGVSTYQYVIDVNQQGLCGATNWQLPNKEQLRSIVDYSTYNPSVDTNYFPNTRGFSYWTSSPYAANDNIAFYIGFDYGGDGGSSKNKRNLVRLVHSEQ